ncbi:MAG: tyrosine-type recombinase/integrase [Clostridia bacterium]|nr:tyrosine-type recombinase/integrase [Clostridia bacterium]
MANTYDDELNRKNLIKIKNILSELPIYANDYFIARKSNTTSKTRLSYAYDLKKFFVWLQYSVPELSDVSIRDISIQTLANVTARDIEEYLDYLQTLVENINNQVTIARKLSCLNSFFSYLVRHDYLVANPCDKVMKPKLKKDNRIIKLSPDEIVRFLDAIEFGCEKMSQRQKKYLETTRQRDLAIATLLLGTGIRVSECVGLNRKDLDFDNCKINLLRKGHKRQFIAMGDEVMDALQAYLPIRNLLTARDAKDEDALFLSTQKTRLGVQAIENMITKYADMVGTREHITPHKLRKTYGTELYGETGDIYLVARALGHESVNTTKDHYIADDEDSLLNARNKVKLR